MYNYTIMPLDVEHIDEICEDINRQYKDGIASCALFMMTLVPEGNPVIDKAEILCKKYELFQNKLNSMGISCGILVQATIGHGYPLDELFPFQQYVNLSDGKSEYICCPYDEGFREHFFNQFATIAKQKPQVIMVDDDFRLMFRGGEGCACPLHLKRVNELSGGNYTREELRERIFKHKDKKLLEIYYKTQGESLIEAAKVMRAGIDSVDPTIPGSFCTCGNSAEFGGEIAKILAGEGNPAIVRINNARYTSAGARNFSPVMYRAARQIAVLKDKVDYILAETDTCPQNRYSTGAYNLHSHFTASIIEGCGGAKHWITRLKAFEPESGEAYRRVLGKYSKFYEALFEIQPSLKHLGCRIPIHNKAQMKLGWDNSEENAWHSFVLERLGFPIYFSHDFGGAMFMDGSDDEIYTDEELFEHLKGTVILSAKLAEKLIERGFLKYIGVEVKEWTGDRTSGELICINGNICSTQIGSKQLIPLDDSVEILSEVYHLKNGKEKVTLFPAVTRFKNELGGTIVTFCGTPRTAFNYVEAFSFLNESRKKQISSILSTSGNLPIFYTGDAEILLRAAYTDNENELFCAAFNIGLDNLDEITLQVEGTVTSVEQLMPDGKRCPVSFKIKGNRITVETKVNILEPVILFFNLNA